MAGWWRRLWRREDDDTARPLYEAVVARARQPHWYLGGGVADTLDGRFDMVTAVLAIVLMRLERDRDAGNKDAGDGGAALAAQVTERFVADMDAQVRQIGFGDMVVGKHVGRMIGMLGGRLGAYRAGITDPDAGCEVLDAALVRNLYRGVAPTPEALAHTREALVQFYAQLQPIGVDALVEGRLP